MNKTSIHIWNFGDIQKIDIQKNGTIDANARRCFKNGHCHSLALAIHKITGFPIYGIADESNSKTDPGHVVVKNPKNGGFIDIGGYGALKRWRMRWGPITVHPLTVKQTMELDTYLPVQLLKALPFAKKVLERINYSFKVSSANKTKAAK